jgi:tetratricopeptide (TPR) repeat protein
LVNLSFAINYHFGSFKPRGWHVTNLALHFSAAMLLWAIVRRTLKLPHFGRRFAASAEWLALAVALLWALHPLQTEAVIYVTQRTELMMALFYLATLYCSLRYWSTFPLSSREACSEQSRTGQGEGSLEAPRRLKENKAGITWLIFAVLACLCGMASKEVMVSAPLVVLLFDRAFVSGSLASALRRSWPLYIGLMATEALLLYLIAHAPRSESAGFAVGIPAISWWFTQSKILLLYLKLAIWPWPLLVHYEFPYLNTIGESWPYVAAVGLLGATTLVLLYCNTAIGFLATFVAAILSPTLVIPIVTEMAAERRMYLPLAAIVAAFVVGGYSLVKNWSQSLRPAQQLAVRRTAIVMAISLIAICCLVSAKRAAVYKNPLDVWSDVLRVQPLNHVAHENMGYHLQSINRADDALNHYREAARISPESIQARYSIATLLLQKGAHDEAIGEIKQALRLVPNDAKMNNNLAVALYYSKRYDEAIRAFRRALELDPNNWVICKSLGVTLKDAGRSPEAIEAYEKALRLNPQAYEIYISMSKAHLQAGHREKAIAALEAGIAKARASGDAQSADWLNAELSNIR